MIDVYNPQYLQNKLKIHPPKLTCPIEHPTFEDVFPIENGDVPMFMFFFQGCNQACTMMQIKQPDRTDNKTKDMNVNHGLVIYATDTLGY